MAFWGIFLSFLAQNSPFWAIFSDFRTIICDMRSTKITPNWGILSYFMPKWAIFMLFWPK